MSSMSLKEVLLMWFIY